MSLGLAAGLAGGWLVWGRASDRVAVALALIEERCAPAMRKGEPFDPHGLVPVARAPQGKLWVEPRSRLAVDPSGRECGVTDALAPFDEERTRFAAGAESLGLRLNPGSAATTPSSGSNWPLFRVVAKGSPEESHLVLMINRLGTGGDPCVSTTEASLVRVLEP